MLLILLGVTSCLLVIDFNNENYDHDNKSVSLQGVMEILICIHLLNFIVMRNFTDKDDKINKTHDWLWVVNLCLYPYLTFEYYESEEFSPD